MSPVLIAIAVFATASVVISKKDIDDAKQFLKSTDNGYRKVANNLMLAMWNFGINPYEITALEEAGDATNELSNFQQKLHQKLKSFKWHKFKNENIKRQFLKLSQVAETNLPEEFYDEYTKILADGAELYRSQVCEFENPEKCDLSIDPELTEIMAESKNPKALEHYWIEWHRVTGKEMRPNFPKLVELANKAAKLNGHEDKSEIWMQDYKAEDFEEQIEACWQEIKPLYQQLHAYVRRALKNEYKDIVSEKGPIPAHLLGNMWAESWDQVANFTLPFPKKTSPNITAAMIAQGVRIRNSLLKEVQECQQDDNV